MIDQENKDLMNDQNEDIEDTVEEAVDNTQIFDGNENEEENEGPSRPTPTPPNKDNRKVLIPIILAAIVILVVLIFVMLQGGGKPVEETPTPTPTPTTTVDTEDYKDDIALWDENYAINSDYVGEIRFDSGIIDLPVVQAIDPDDPSIGLSKYLRTDWKTMEHDEEGSIFVDPVSDLESSQNITIYGHYVYPSYEPSMTHKFTPLVNYVGDKDFYEENKYFELILKDEVRRYEIAHVYIADINLYDPNNPLEEGMYYMEPEWTEEELEYYLDRVSEIEEYDTGVEIGPDDKFVTLQTCVENREDQREIVIAKQIEVIKIR